MAEQSEKSSKKHSQKHKQKEEEEDTQVRDEKEMANKGLKAIVLGGTGEIGRVRPLAKTRPGIAKLEEILVSNFDELDQPQYAEHFQGMDAAFNAFGTTRRDAGGAEEFRKIDFGYSAKFGQQCHDAGIPNVQLVTSVGADPNSFLLYTEVKGKLEQLYESFKFKSLLIWRPGLLGRENPRFVEKLALFFVKGMPVSRIGQAMRMEAERIAQTPPAEENYLQRYTDKDINRITGN